MKVMLDDGAYIPERAHDLDAGYDLRSPMRVVLHPHSNATIDTGYTGSIRVKLYNNGALPHVFNEGDKLIQLVILPIYTPALELVEELDETERGESGFGSTGR